MRVTSLIQNRQLLADIQGTQSRLQEAQSQISSGKKTETFDGLGPQARLSLDLRAETRRLDAFQQNITQTRMRTSRMEEVMTRVTDIAAEMKEEIIKARDGDDPDMALLNRMARDRITEVNNLLNEEIDGVHLFAGIDSDNAPMLDPAPNLAFTDTELTGYNQANAAAKLANLRAHFANETNFYGGDTGPQQLAVTIDSGQNLEYGKRGDMDGMSEIMSGLHMLAELDYDPDEQQAWGQLMEGAFNDLDSGFSRVNSQVGVLGAQIARMERIEAGHEQARTLLQKELGAVEDVDMAEASTRFQGLQNQLQSSFQVASTVRELTLANFL